MIQNSRSPVVKSRISSSSGRTMSVEKRSLAWMGTMSSFPYLTTRAPSAPANACDRDPKPRAANKKQDFRKRPLATFEERDFIGMPPCWESDSFLRISFVRPLRNRLNEIREPRKQPGKHERKHAGGNSKFFREICRVRDHRRAPAKTSRPFSNP